MLKHMYNSENLIRVEEFRKLIRNTLFDFILIKPGDNTDGQVMFSSLQIISDIDQMAEEHGFTGFRKVLMVAWSAKIFFTKNKKTPGNAEISRHLKDGTPCPVPSVPLFRSTNNYSTGEPRTRILFGLTYPWQRKLVR